MQLQSDLKKKLEPYVDRKGPDVLRELLPPIYDNLLYLQRSIIQAKLLNLEEKARKEKKKSINFFRYVFLRKTTNRILFLLPFLFQRRSVLTFFCKSWYSSVAPLLNHPGTLKLSRATKGKQITWKSMDDIDTEWFKDPEGKVFNALQKS